MSKDLIGLKVDVLDHGFIRVVDYMGDDSAIVQAARVSYGEGTKTIQDDTALIRYLLRNRHTSPLEMCELKLHCKMPIFVARQWVRHRTASLNELSARYSVMPDEVYIPGEGVLKAQSKNNKQGRDGELPEFVNSWFREMTAIHADNAFSNYDIALGQGVARELARINLPVNTYTEWYWKIDLHNLLHFLNLRMNPHAQYEIRMYANVIYQQVVRQWVPITAEAFHDYVLGAETFSNHEMTVIQGLVKEVGRDRVRKLLSDVSGLSKREQTEFLDKLGV